MKLGELRRFDLRAVWQHEENDFTPWLEEHIDLLAETLGLEDDFEVESREAHIGRYRADLICFSQAGRVLVGNQLGETDHSHLGQVLSYAAGIEATVVVWVAASFTEEHRAAIDWLNRITDGVDFFGLEIELWQIGNSDPAPKFNIVSKPNDWSRSVAARGLVRSCVRRRRRVACAVATGSPKSTTADEERRGREYGSLTGNRKVAHQGRVDEPSVHSRPTRPISPLGQMQLKYWTIFRKVLLASNGPVEASRPQAGGSFRTHFGQGGFSFDANMDTQKGRIRAELYITIKDAIRYFDALEKDRADIESALGFALDWQPLDGKKACRIAIRKDVDPKDESTWPEQHEWLASHLNRMHEVLAPKVRDFKPIPEKPDDRDDIEDIDSFVLTVESVDSVDAIPADTHRDTGFEAQPPREEGQQKEPAIISVSGTGDI